MFRLRKPILALTLCTAIAIVGCTASQVEAYINLAAQIAVNVLQVVSAVGNTPISGHDMTIISQFQQVLQNSVANFEVNKAMGNSSLISVAEAAQTEIPAFLKAAQFDNPLLAARVTAAANSFLTIVEAIAATVAPNVVIPPPPAAVVLKDGTVFGAPARVKVSRHDIVNQWNQVVCAGASAACYVH